MTDVTAPATGQGATPSADPAPINSSAAPGTTTSTPASTPASTDWTSGLAPETASYVQNKGWKAPTDLLNSYQQLEKHMGTPADKLLRLPDWNKAEKSEIDGFYTKLGRPADPTLYELPVPEGAPKDMADWAKPIFHEAGLTNQQAKVIAEKWNEHIAGLGVKQKETYAQTIEQQNNELKTEWGQAYDQEIGKAKNAAKALGIKPEQIDALEGSLGFANLMKMMANIGSRIGEDNYVGGDVSSGSGALTPVGAQSRIKQLQGDKEWTAKYLGGNIQARAEMERLMQMAYPS
jgi:hypothetical protein